MEAALGAATLRGDTMRKFLAALAAAVLVSTAWLPAGAIAQSWPQKQVTIVVPFSAGGTTDMFGRILANALQAKLGQPFVVENKAGAGGNIGTASVAKAPKDGYTILVG